MIYGYARRQVSNEGLLELREVTFTLDPQCLRRVAEFLIACADEIDAGTFRSSHRHIDTFDRDWSAKCSASDVIVSSPTAPRQNP